MNKKITALITTAAISVSLITLYTPISSAAQGISGASTMRVAEQLDRGLAAIKTTDGVYLSWRLQADEDNVYGTASQNTVFDIYRNGTKIASEANTTNYTDNGGTASSKYQVVKSGENRSVCKEVTPFSSGSNYFDITLDKPADATLADGGSASYTANDASCGDLDGDGELEIVLKWDANGKDNSQDGYTGNVYLDAYKLNGEKLWRIDLGQNIRGGAHYTQFLVYDFDGDGIAEITAQTAAGSKGGDGNYVTKTSHVSTINAYTEAENQVQNVGSNGKILKGDEFLTIFDGKTGKALDTIYYPNQRVAVKTWGDKDEGYGNRNDRFTADVAYLDGAKPYAVYMRGYYMRQGGGNSERQAACAVSFDGNQLECKYSFDTYDVNNYSSKSTSSSYHSDGSYKGIDGYRSGNEKYVGQGNHNCTVADVDGDGKDEVMTGALCYELENEILGVKWCTYRQHGDALHIGDYDPTHDGYEFFTVHEDGGVNNRGDSEVVLDYGMSVIDAKTGDLLFHEGAGGDTGRGIMANVGAGGYYQFLSSSNAARMSTGGTSTKKALLPGASYNFRIFWDGDLNEELLDGTTVSNWNGAIMYPIFGASGCTSINGTKSNPALQADLFGDWREELVYPLSNNSALRVFTTNIPTEHKMKSLMYDNVYRCGVAAEQTAYNQPPHIGYYIPTEPQSTDESAPNIEIPEGAAVVLNQNADGTGTDKTNYDEGIYACEYVDDGAAYTGVKGLSVQIGGDKSRRDGSKLFGIKETGDGNGAFLITAGRYSSALRGITTSFTDSLENVSSENKGVLTFALKLYDGGSGYKGALYLLSNTAANRNNSDYANKIAAITTDDIGVNTWAVVKYVFTGTSYELYIDGKLKSSGATSLAGLPILALPTCSASAADPYTAAMLDNIVTYTLDENVQVTPDPDTEYEENVLYERGYDTAWSEDDKTAWGATELTTQYGLHQSGGNGSNSAQITINPPEDALLDVEAYWVGMSNLGRGFADGNCSYFRFGNIWVMQNDQTQASAYSLSPFTSSNFTNFTGPNKYRDYEISNKNWYVINMRIDTKTNTLEKMTVRSSADLDTNLLELSDVALTDYDYQNIVMGYVKTKSVSTANNEYLQKIKVSQLTVKETPTPPEKKSLENAVISPVSDTEYTGSAITPDITVTLDGVSLVKDTDYTVEYSNNTNVGTATITITGIGDYSGTASATFNITQPTPPEPVKTSIENAVISSVADVEYTGSPITPNITVTLNGTTLTKDTDYTIEYSNNTNVGTATITITGIGDYSGTASATFNITSHAPKPPITENSVKFENGKAVITSVSDITATVIFASYENNVLTSISVVPNAEIKTGTTEISPDSSFSAAVSVKVFVWNSLTGMTPVIY